MVRSSTIGVNEEAVENVGIRREFNRLQQRIILIPGHQALAVWCTDCLMRDVVSQTPS